MRISPKPKVSETVNTSLGMFGVFESSTTTWVQFSCWKLSQTFPPFRANSVKKSNLELIHFSNLGPSRTGIFLAFSNLSFNCSNLLDLSNLQEQVKKAFCYHKLFGPFTVRTNCSSDLKMVFLTMFLCQKLVFCYHNCSDLLWEKIVRVIEKTFEIRDFAKILRSL